MSYFFTVITVLFVGVVIGYATAALLTIAKKADEQSEYYIKHEKKEQDQLKSHK